MEGSIIPYFSLPPLSFLQLTISVQPHVILLFGSHCESWIEVTSGSRFRDQLNYQHPRPTTSCDETQLEFAGVGVLRWDI